MQVKLNEYETKAQDFLNKHEIDFSFVLIGNDCPQFCQDAHAGREMDKVEKYPRRTHIHGKHYRCTFTRRHSPSLEPGRKLASGYTANFSIDFWNSYADEEFNWAKKNWATLSFPQMDKIFGNSNIHNHFTVSRHPVRVPTPYDVLACLQKSPAGTFEDFCGDYGYDQDSRKAEAIYWAIVAEWRKISLFFYAEEIVELQEIQ